MVLKLLESRGDIIMSQFLKSLIVRKLKGLTYEELQYYSDEYGFSLSERELSDIINYLRNHFIDPFHANGRMQMVQELTRITNAQTAQKAQRLFNELIKSYGVEHLFN